MAGGELHPGQQTAPSNLRVRLTTWPLQTENGEKKITKKQKTRAKIFNAQMRIWIILFDVISLIVRSYFSFISLLGSSGVRFPTNRAQNYLFYSSFWVLTAALWSSTPNSCLINKLDPLNMAQSHVSLKLLNNVNQDYQQSSNYIFTLSSLNYA